MNHQSLNYSAIPAILNAMHQMLQDALQCIAAASLYADQQQQNAAIGATLPLEETIKQISSLYHAVIALHRFKPLEDVCA